MIFKAFMVALESHSSRIRPVSYENVFLDKSYANRAQDQKDSCDDHHIALHSTTEFQNDSTESSRHNLGKANGAVEETKVAAHMLTLEGIGQERERDGQHGGPGSSNEEV